MCLTTRRSWVQFPSWTVWDLCEVHVPACSSHASYVGLLWVLRLGIQISPWLFNLFVCTNEPDIKHPNKQKLYLLLLQFSGSVYLNFLHLIVSFSDYRLSLKSHSGTAGRQSSMVMHGADFSTKDIDNDNCNCKCSLMLTGGKRLKTYVFHEEMHNLYFHYY